jgi:serine/threonine-protein kinase
MIGKTVSHYKILAKLGEGGMGEVYLAEDTELDRKVALKFLPLFYSKDPEVNARFEREAKATAALNHPNIITIHEIGEFEGRAYIAMEYVDRKSLKDKIADKEFSIASIIDLSIQVCEGLHEAHKAGIVHRDIKPDNILIDSAGRAKILDFGLAQKRGATKLTKEATTLGTIHYMSPEQCQTGDVDQRTDIWSLGIVLYEMITGKTPFQEEYETGIAYSIMNEDPEPLARYKTGVSDELQRIVDKALRKDVATRYQNVAELLADLKGLQKETAITDVPRSIKQKNKIRVIIYAVATLLVLLVIVLLSKWDVPFLSREEHSIAVLPLKSITNDTDQDWFAEGMTDALTTDLAKIGGLRVISQSSVMRYKDSDTPIPEIARALGVNYVLDASILKVGEQVRISAKLINAPKDEHLWAENFERKFSNAFALQGEIAREVANQIRVKLTRQENERLSSAREVNPDAYEAYLRGRFHFSKHSSEGYSKSIEYFDRAVRIDSGLALAYAGLGDVYSKVSIGGFIPSLSQEEALLKAGLAVNKAIELDSTLAEAYSARAHLRRRKWDWVGSERDFQRAIKMNPNYSWAYHNYAALLESQGRHDEAITNRKQALELDPLNVVMNVMMAAPYTYSGDHDKAISILEDVREMYPNEAFVYHVLALPYVGKGMYEKAIELWQEFFRLYGSKPGPVYVQMGAAYARAGKKEEALKILHELIDRSERESGLLDDIAGLYFQLGETDKAFEWWEKAYARREPSLKGALNSDDYSAMPDSLRSDPRFVSLLRRVGLQEKL